MIFDYTFITDQEQSVKVRPPFPGSYAAYVFAVADPGKILLHKKTNQKVRYIYTTEVGLEDWEEVLDEN